MHTVRTSMTDQKASVSGPDVVSGTRRPSVGRRRPRPAAFLAVALVATLGACGASDAPADAPVGTTVGATTPSGATIDPLVTTPANPNAGGLGANDPGATQPAP